MGDDPRSALAQLIHWLGLRVLAEGGEGGRGILGVLALKCTLLAALALKHKASR